MATAAGQHPLLGLAGTLQREIPDGLRQLARSLRRKEGHLRAGNWAKRGFYAGRWSLIYRRQPLIFWSRRFRGQSAAGAYTQVFGPYMPMPDREAVVVLLQGTHHTALKRCRIFCGPWQSRLKKASSSMALTTVIPAGFYFLSIKKARSSHQAGTDDDWMRELRFIRGDAPSVFIRTSRAGLLRSHES